MRKEGRERDHRVVVTPSTSKRDIVHLLLCMSLCLYCSENKDAH